MINIDAIDKLTLILSALSIFFTLITGAFAIAAGFFIFYLKKLADDKNVEIKKFNQLGDDLRNKIKEVEGLKSDNKKEIETVKTEYSDLRNRFFHLITGSNALQIIDGSGGPTINQLTDQINSLLAMIASLQKQLAESKVDKK